LDVLDQRRPGTHYVEARCLTEGALL